MSSDENLPVGWLAVPLGDIADVQLGKMLDKKNTQGTRLPYLRNINVRWGSIALDDLLDMPYKETELKRFGIQDGDVLVCEGGEPGRAAVWRNGATDIKYQKALHRVRFAAKIEPDWLVYNLYYDATRGGLARHFTGTTIAHFTGQAIREYPMRVAPLKEQARTLEAIESYFTRLDDAVATLERVERNLKRYRASVLKSAVEGRLVPTEAELAKQEGRNYEPADVLLSRILKERKRRWEQAELAKMQAKGKPPTNDKWKAKYQEPAAPDTTNLPDLPEGWCWASLDSFVWNAGYGTSQKCTPDAEGPPVLRIPNVQNQAIQLEDLKYATAAEKLSPDGMVEPGDFLFIRTNGSQNLIGRGAVVLRELPKPHHFASYLIRLRLIPAGTLAAWVGLVWHAPPLRQQILAGAASSAGQFNVSLGSARSFAVPLAPPVEQQRILVEVERLDSLALASAALARRASERSTRLRQAILKWAFEGKLADQDPTDEPASALLERIRAEREAAAPTKKNTAGRRKRGGKKVLKEKTA